MTNQKPNKYFAFDTETGGLDPTRHSLLTLYAILMDEDYTVTECVDLMLKPSDGAFVVDPGALRINKIDLVAHAKKAVTYEEGREKLLAVLEKNDSKLEFIGHSVAFDIGFLENHLLTSNEIAGFFARDLNDTKLNANFLKKCGVLPATLPTALQTLAAWFFKGTDLSGHHNAEWDAKMTVEILKKELGMIKRLLNTDGAVDVP
jgi:DNA polymerase III epsilon subunit-like protein